MGKRAIDAIMSELWAIDPGYLPLIAAIAQRDVGHETIKTAQGWTQRDYQLLAGPGAMRLDGASMRTFVTEGVAVISVMGPIFPRANLMTEMSGATSIATLQSDVRVAMASEDVGAVLFAFDTPGGAVSGVNATADMLDDMRKKMRKPMMSHVSGAAASAGYWLASSIGEIAMDRTAIAGSIGVVTVHGKQIEPGADGYVEVEVVSSNAQNKRPDPTTDDGLAEIRATLDAIEREFIADVARGRGVSVKHVVEQYGQGGVKVGSDAVAAGMADRIESFDSSLKRMKQMARANKRAASIKK